MILNRYYNPRDSIVLFEHNDNFNFLMNLYNSKKLPKVLMLSGKKGEGKFTLVNHFLNNVFDNQYNNELNKINADSKIYQLYLKDIFPNIIYLEGENFKNIKIDNIRSLKSILLKSTFLKKERFIILDDVELFNVNSLNALLKLIEEPGSNDYFVLINNNSKKLLETIHSRSLEIKIFLSNIKRLNIINFLIKKNDIDTYIDYENNQLTPGNFLVFNRICKENKIDLNNNFIDNLDILLSLYKKKKDINLINMTLYLTDLFFYRLYKDKSSNIDKIDSDKSFVISNLNKFISFNLNQNSFLNAINYKLSNG